MKNNTLYKYIPELENVKNTRKYKKIFEDTYRKRYKKVGKKALHSSVALVYGEMVKDFNEGTLFNEDFKLIKAQSKVEKGGNVYLKSISKKFNERLKDYFTEDFLKKLRYSMPKKIKIISINRSNKKLAGITYMQPDDIEFKIIGNFIGGAKYNISDPPKALFKNIYINKNHANEDIIRTLIHEFLHLASVKKRVLNIFETVKLKTHLLNMFTDKLKKSYEIAPERFLAQTLEMIPSIVSNSLITNRDLIPNKKLYKFSLNDLKKIKEVIKKYNIFNSIYIDKKFEELYEIRRKVRK